MQSQILDLNRLVALFLSEAIRSRRTSLARAAEISRRVLSKIHRLDSESKALAELTEIEKDFQELAVLKQALHFGHNVSDVKLYENEIKEFASKVFTKDIQFSNNFLQDSVKQGVTIEELCLKYPDFCEFLQNSPEKGHVIRDLTKNQHNI